MEAGSLDFQFPPSTTTPLGKQGYRKRKGLTIYPKEFVETIETKVPTSGW